MRNVYVHNHLILRHTHTDSSFFWGKKIHTKITSRSKAISTNLHTHSRLGVCRERDSKRLKISSENFFSAKRIMKLFQLNVN